MQVPIDELARRTLEAIHENGYSLRAFIAQLRYEERSVDALTAREKEITIALVRGTKSSDLATTMGLSRKTIEQHKCNIYRKLKIHSIAQLIHWAYFHKLIELPNITDLLP